jgi:hypothetical protein
VATLLETYSASNKLGIVRTFIPSIRCFIIVLRKVKLRMNPVPKTIIKIIQMVMIWEPKAYVVKL